ncbi:MAG TPA: ABC transporter substrate-binding protein [Stellaceae bacterium]|jgi:NitT/TauT family transport system substrate-binding protein
MSNHRLGRRPVLKGLAATAAASLAMPRIGRAAGEKLVVGKSVATLLAYTPIDVGLANNLYQKHGLDLEVVAFDGSARLHQAMVAGSIDIALGSGATMSDVGKGEPSLCIAETLGPPADIAIIVPWDSPIKTPDDMRGRVTGVASAGSVTEWVLFELARQKGWPLSDMKTVGLGGIQASIAAIRTKQVEAIVSDVAAGFFLEPQKIARVLAPCSSYITDFVMHANYASTKAMTEKPAAVTAFCAGWFEAVEVMQRDKEQTVRIGTPIMHFDSDIVGKTYDIIVPKMSRTGRFDPKGLATLARSYVVMKTFPTEPDMAKFYTEKFLPKA